MQGRRHYHTYVCYECHLPCCKLCQERPKLAVSHNASKDNECICIRCKYPPSKLPCLHGSKSLIIIIFYRYTCATRHRRTGPIIGWEVCPASDRRKSREFAWNQLGECCPGSIRGSLSRIPLSGFRPESADGYSWNQWMDFARNRSMGFCLESVWFFPGSVDRV